MATSLSLSHASPPPCSLSLPLSPRAVKIGIKALFALCLVKQHRERAVAAGAVEALIDRLVEYEKCDAKRALATVELLCRISAGCAAFSVHALTVPLLVKIILKISDRATEYAAGALLLLCSASERAKRDAVLQKSDLVGFGPYPVELEGQRGGGVRIWAGGFAFDGELRCVVVWGLN